MQFYVVLSGKEDSPQFYLPGLYAFIQGSHETIKSYLSATANLKVNDIHVLEFRAVDNRITIRIKAVSELYKNTKDILICDSIISAFWQLIYTEYDIFPKIECYPEPTEPRKSCFSCCRKSSADRAPSSVQVENLGDKVIW